MFDNERQIDGEDYVATNYLIDHSRNIAIGYI